MKRNVFITSLFIFLIILISCLNLFQKERPEISELENRKLAVFPEFSWEVLFSGDYLSDIDDFIADTFIFREQLVHAGNIIKSYRGLSGEDKVELISIKSQDQFAAPVEEKDVKLLPGEGSYINNYLVLKNRVLEIVNFLPESGKYYAAALNALCARLDKSVSIYSILIPTQIEFIENQQYREMSYPQKKAMKYIQSFYNKRIIPVDIFSKLEKHKNEYIYFRTDHHWTALGAYYAYQAFAEIKGFKSVDLEKFETVAIKDFLGSLYDKCLNKDVRRNSDTIFVYKPFVKSTFTIYEKGKASFSKPIDMDRALKRHKYLVFIGGDEPLGIIKTEIKNGRKIAIFKDSYANAFIPFLMPHYEEIHIIDPRYYNKDAVSHQKFHNIQDVLFINYFVVVCTYKGFARHIFKVGKSGKGARTMKKSHL